MIFYVKRYVTLVYTYLEYKEYIMQKISPLRAGLDAFNRFKTARLQAKTNKMNDVNSNSTNPFGISFKGTMIQMDVFESSTKNNEVSNPIKAGLEKVNKFTASARMAAMNKINAIKENAVSFGRKIKENISNTYNKLATTEVNFDFLKNTSSSLQKKPVGELEDMFKSEIAKLEGK